MNFCKAALKQFVFCKMLQMQLTWWTRGEFWIIFHPKINRKKIIRFCIKTMKSKILENYCNMVKIVLLWSNKNTVFSVMSVIYDNRNYKKKLNIHDIIIMTILEKYVPKRKVHPKNKIYSIYSIYSPLGHPRCRWVCFFIWTVLEKCSITSHAHQWMLCSEWVPSEWESKQLIKTSQ